MKITLKDKTGKEISFETLYEVDKGRIPYRYYKEMLKETFNTEEK